MRVGILADIHENISELESRVKQAEALNCDELACLGDITGFDKRFYSYSNNRSASKCVRLVRDYFKWVVPGNHDLFAALRVPSWSNGFEYPPEWFSLDTGAKRLISDGKVWCYENEETNDLTRNEIEFLREINEVETAGIDNLSVLFSHYIFPDLTGSTTRFVTNKGQMANHWKLLVEKDVTYSFVAHQHNEFAGFSYRSFSPLLKAFNHIPADEFTLGDEPTVIMVPPVSGESGKTGFIIFDTKSLKINIIRGRHE